MMKTRLFFLLTVFAAASALALPPTPFPTFPPPTPTPPPAPAAKEPIRLNRATGTIDLPAGTINLASDPAFAAPAAVTTGAFSLGTGLDGSANPALSGNFDTGNGTNFVQFFGATDMPDPSAANLLPDSFGFYCNDGVVGVWSRVGTGDPVAHPLSSGGGGGFVKHTYTTDTAKVTATGVAPGDYAVITGEGGRVEQFIPSSVAMVIPDFSGSAGLPLGPYIQPNGSAPYSLYVLESDYTKQIYPYMSGWAIGVPGSTLIASSSQDVATPDLVTDWTYYGTAFSVVRNDAASQTNWAVLKNTVNLSVNSGHNAAFVNGVMVVENNTNVGWVDPSSISLRYPAGGSALDFLQIDTPEGISHSFNNQHSVSTSPFSLCLPVLLAPRSSVTITLKPNPSGGDG